jgi:Ca-activated chloride channel homolog
MKVMARCTARLHLRSLTTEVSSFLPFLFNFRRSQWKALVPILLILTAFSPQAVSQMLPQDAAAIAAGALPTFRKQVDEVNVVFTVTNKHGHFVHNLSENDLAVLDNDQPPEKITYFQSQTDLPLRVALVIDSSDSVTNRFAFERKSALAFLKRILRPKSDMGLVIGFNQQIHVTQTATANLGLLANGLRELHPNGETAIYDAVTVACQQLTQVRDTEPSRRVIILITDGEDNRSHIGLQQAVDAALHSDTVVYVLSTNPEYSIDLAEQGDKDMKELSESTGGRLLRAADEDGVSGSFIKLEKELRSQYALGYKPATNHADGLFHRLTLLGPHKLKVFHRLGYFAR